jgi:hypothetical protein
MWLFKGNRCSCLPTYTPGVTTPKCPSYCLQAASVIYPAEDGLACGETLSIDLTDLTNPGNCNCGVEFLVEPSDFSTTLVGGVLTVEHNIDSDGDRYYDINYIMKCTCDLRSIMGTITVFAKGVC